MNIVNIVSNNFMLKYFRKIKIFKLDLGSNLKGPSNSKDNENSIKILDEFIKKYRNLNGNFIRKYGDIGKLRFYEDGEIESNIFHVYSDDKIYEIVASDNDLKKEPADYLTEILKMLENGTYDDSVVDESENVMIKDVSYSNMPETLDRPNIKLPKDQYIEALVIRRKLLDQNNNI